ncbi:NINE protein [Zymobacter sp. IVIA_12111.31 C1]|uniref:TM2 domain-containing protein n=1 Tax=Zymobacter sp. IVIA_12111.31 C1 TaxID=3394854 RepID=UPI0039C4C14D
MSDTDNTSENTLVPTEQEEQGNVPAESKANALRPNMIYCYGCGQQIHQQARACPHCGAPSRSADSLQNVLGGKGKNRIVAAVLAFWLGIFGAHRFYLGNPIMAIFYILFFWTLIPSFVALGEGIYFLCMDPQRFDEKYNRRR